MTEFISRDAGDDDQQIEGSPIVYIIETRKLKIEISNILIKV